MSEKVSGVYPPLPEGQGGSSSASASHPPSYEQSQAAGYGAASAGGFQNPPTDNKGGPYHEPPTMPTTNDGPTIVQPVVIQYVQAPEFGFRPVHMVCPHCSAEVRTETDSEPGAVAWILGGVLCLVGLWPCSCLPCCVDSLNAVTHRCPSCKKVLGRYKGGL